MPWLPGITSNHLEMIQGMVMLFKGGAAMPALPIRHTPCVARLCRVAPYALRCAAMSRCSIRRAKPTDSPSQNLSTHRALYAPNA